MTCAPAVPDATMATLRTNLLLVRAFALAIKIRVSLVEVQSYGVALQLFLNSWFPSAADFQLLTVLLLVSVSGCNTCLEIDLSKLEISGRSK